MKPGHEECEKQPLVQMVETEYHKHMGEYHLDSFGSIMGTVVVRKCVKIEEESTMADEKMEVRTGLPPYDEAREKELEAKFDPARHVKVKDEEGRVRILHKSWGWAADKTARMDEEKRP